MLTTICPHIDDFGNVVVGNSDVSNLKVWVT